MKGKSEERWREMREKRITKFYICLLSARLEKIINMVLYFRKHAKGSRS